MASNVTLSDGMRTANGWEIESANESLVTNLDNFPMPLSDSSSTRLFDYEGRNKTVVLRGVLKEGATLGIGTGFSVTTLGEQIDALNTYFFNNSSGGVQLTLVRPNQSNISVGLSTWRVRRKEPNLAEFQITLVEGTVT